MGFASGFIVGSILATGISFFVFFTESYPIPQNNWRCTASVRVGDTLPEQYECVEYRKKVKE